ncbi:MAG: PaaI family thioesterase [Phycisphaerae bacterium]
MLDQTRLDELLAACCRAPCIESLQLNLLDAEIGSCRMSAPIDPRFNGLIGGFHGGMLAMVADCVAWFAIATHTGPTEAMVTTDLDIRYLAPCMTAVTATARVIKLGKTLCPVSIEMVDDNGKLVATGIVTYIRLSNLAK